MKHITLPNGALVPVPDWVSFAAQNLDGQVYLYQGTPKPGTNGGWYPDTGHAQSLPLAFPVNPDWEKSLQCVRVYYVVNSDEAAPELAANHLRNVVEAHLQQHEEVKRVYAERLAMGHLRTKAERDEDADVLAIEAAQVACLRSILDEFTHPAPL